MKPWSKMLTAAAVAALVAMPTQTANAWPGWGDPLYGDPLYTHELRHAYKHDPAYWFAPPVVRSDIRRAYRFRDRSYPYRHWRRGHRGWWW